MLAQSVQLFFDGGMGRYRSGRGILCIVTSSTVIATTTSGRDDGFAVEVSSEAGTCEVMSNVSIVSIDD